MRKFDFFEFVGIIVPGGVFLLLLAYFIPSLRGVILTESVSVNLLGLGIGFIVVYGVGRLIEAVGGFVIRTWWRMWGGKPTDWMSMKNQKAFPKEWKELIVKEMGIRNAKKDIPLERWKNYVNEIRAIVSHTEKCYQRVYIFLGNSHLFRGLATVGLFYIVAQIGKWLLGNITTKQKFLSWEFWWNIDFGLVLLGLGVVALCFHQIYRFGKNYANELFSQYVSLIKEK